MACKDITDYQIVKNQDDYAKGLVKLCTIEHLSVETGQHIKVIYRCYERAEARQYIECGVSLRTAWLTDKGRQLLNKGQANE